MKLAKCKVSFDEPTHTYLYEGRYLEGVTAMLKAQGLSVPYANISRATLDHAAARGTAIHKTLEAYDNGEPLVVPVSVFNPSLGDFEAFDTSGELKAYRNLGLDVVASEYLVSDYKIIASAIDKVVYVDENTVDLADIKSTSTYHADNVSAQLSVYAYLFEKMNPKIKVRNLFGIHVRDGQAKIKPAQRYPKDWVELLLQCEATRLASGDEMGVFLDLYNPEASMEEAMIVSDQMIADEMNLAQAEALVKTLKAALEEKRAELYEYMMSSGKAEIAVPGGRFKLKLPTTRSGVDAAALKKDGLYDKYAKTTEVKGSVSFIPE